MRRRASFAMAGAAVVVAGLVATAVLAFPTGARERAIATPTLLPATLEPFVFNLCLPSVDVLDAAADAEAAGGSDASAGVDYLAFSTQGSGGSFSARVEAPGLWHVDASRHGVTVQEETGSQDGALGPVPRAIAVAQQMYDCLSPYRFVEQQAAPDSSSQLLQLYTYDSRVLWPCLVAHGLKVGDPPTRADFATAGRAQSVDPFSSVDLSKPALPRLIAAARACPQRPSYLH